MEDVNEGVMSLCISHDGETASLFPGDWLYNGNIWVLRVFALQWSEIILKFSCGIEKWWMMEDAFMSNLNTNFAICVTV